MPKINPELMKIREYRKKAGWTIKEVGEKLGISRAMYGHIENGEKRLSYGVAVKLADLYGVTPDELFYEEYKEFFKNSLI